MHETITSQPTPKPTTRPNASRAYMYVPPERSNMAPTSA